MKIKKVKCLVPFTTMHLGSEGYVRTCCPSWTKVAPLGNVKKIDIKKIWNSERARRIRKAILEDRLEDTCNINYCPNALRDEYIDLEDFKTDDVSLKRIIEEVKQGKVHLENGPTRIEVSDSGECNLRCKMCRSHDGFLRTDKRLGHIVFGKVLPKLLPEASFIQLLGNGEVFFRKESRDFLEDKSTPKKYPQLKIQLLSNGLLFNQTTWNKIKHNQFDFVSISCDGASKETYEKIRRRGKWEVLQKNLRLISSLRKKGHFKWFQLNFVVMRSNYKEMKDFVKLGLSLGCDCIFFQKIYSLVDTGENVNASKDLKVLQDIARIIEDPLFQRKEVDTSLLDEYKQYGNKQISFGKRIGSWLFTKLFFYPGKLYYNVRYNLTPLYDFFLRFR